MSKLVTSDGLNRVAKSLNDKIKTEINRAVAKEELLSQNIQDVEDMLGGKSIRYVTQAEYDNLTDLEKNNTTITYFITDAEDASHEHDNLDDLNNYGKRTMTIGKASEEFYGAANVAFTLAEIGAAEAEHNHNDEYYTKSEIDTKVEDINDSIASEVAELSADITELDNTKLDTDVAESSYIQSIEVQSENEISVHRLCKNGNIISPLVFMDTIIDSENNNLSIRLNSLSKNISDEISRAKAEEQGLQAAINGKAASGHTHDDIYYTETEMNTKLAGKSDTGHTHDDRYYTSGQIDNKVSTLNTAITTAKSDAQKYADDKITALVDSAPAAMNTLNELAKAINDHQDEYKAYVQTVSSGIAAAKSEAIASAESKDAALKTTLQAEIDADVKVEKERAMEAENALQATINGKANASHGNHVPDTQTADNTKFLRNDNNWATVTPGNIGAYTKAEIDSKVTTINNAISGKANSSHGNHVPDTQTANNAVFLRNDNTWQTVTPSNIGAYSKSDIDTKVSALQTSINGKADSTHGTHLTLGTGSGNAYYGDKGKVAYDHSQAAHAPSNAQKNSDITKAEIEARLTGTISSHSHAPQTTIAGNAGSATKWKTARTFTIGNKGQSVDGTSDVAWTLSEIGAFPAAGGTLGGEIDYQFAGVGGHAIGINWRNNDTNKTKFGSIGGLANAGVGSLLYMGWGSAPWVEANNFNVSSSAIKYKGNKIYHAGDKPTLSELGAAAADHGTHVTYASSAPKANGTAAVGSSSKVAREDHVHPLQTSVSGNAGTATTLQTARNISLGGVLSGSASFNGSQNITISASIANPLKSGNWFSGGIPAVSTDGVMEVGKYIDFHNTGTSTNDYDVRLQANTSTPCVITLPTGSGTLARTTDNITGNAATATKLETARNIVIGNKTNSFNGTGNITYTLSDIGASPLQKSVVSQTRSGTTLNLSKDRYQKASLKSGDNIVLPSVTDFTEINLFVQGALTNINLPNNCKWRVDHNLSTGTSYMFTFIYTTVEWLAEVKIYS